MDSTSIITQVSRDEEPLSVFPSQEKGKIRVQLCQQTWLPTFPLKILLPHVNIAL